MGRVYRALSRASRSDGRAGPARYPATTSPKRPASTGNALRSVGPALEGTAALTSESPTALPPPTRSLVAVENPPAKVETERILFKAFRITRLNVDDRLPAIRLDDGPAQEIYRTIAVRLSSIAARQDLKTIMVTSARRGEGKTSIAANLAASLARVGKERVLLVEGDLRRPTLGQRMGLLARFGWGDLIEGRSSLLDSIARIEPGGLHVLINRSECQRGRPGIHGNLADLMASQRPEELLTGLKHEFDLIVIDCPCITEYAEAQRMSLIADGTILVARAGRTHHRAVTEALKLVPKERRIGIVLNDSKA